MTDLIETYRARVLNGELARDPLQERAADRLARLARQLARYRRGRRGFFIRAEPPPRGLYIWGDVGRGKSMLMDLFFRAVTLPKKRRIHFNAFMGEAHGLIHAERQKEGTRDPIPPVAALLAARATVLCFDEFQVTDVADAMILGRLFEQLFALGVVVVATSNTPPERLYEGGLNRQLFQPFIALIEQTLDIVELNGKEDYRRRQSGDDDLYIYPLGPLATRKMDRLWQRLTSGAPCPPAQLSVLGRSLRVPAACDGVARFHFDDLCNAPLAANDFLAIARAFHTVLIDEVPAMGPAMRNQARRFVLLIDTFYDERVRLICSAAAPADSLYPEGDGADAFRRTASRLIEMQSDAYSPRPFTERVG
jgi:cell division protein ZapE